MVLCLQGSHTRGAIFEASEFANSIPPFLKLSYPVVLFNAIGYKPWLLHMGVVEAPLCNFRLQAVTCSRL
jgi:hypothetical protein